MVKLRIVDGAVCAGAGLLSLLDLVKAVGGSAVQGVNIVFGFAETRGLWQLPRLQ